MPSRSRRNLVLGTALAPLAGIALGAAESNSSTPLQVVYPRLLERPAHAFGFQVLGLALQRSGQPYQLRLGDELVSGKAAVELLRSGQINVLDNGSAGRSEDAVSVVPVPIDFGLSGCRMLLGKREVLKRLRHVRRLEELFPLVFGQGIDWTDSRILRNAGLRVEEGEFRNLLRMLQGGRFDLVPLGSEEADEILDSQRANAPDVAVDASVGLFYPYPRVFYVPRGSTELHAALTRGLKLAHEDGSLLELLKRAPGIGPILTGKRALPKTLIAMPNPWLPAGLHELSAEHFHPALRTALRSVWPNKPQG